MNIVHYGGGLRFTTLNQLFHSMSNQTDEH